MKYRFTFLLFGLLFLSKVNAQPANFSLVQFCSGFTDPVDVTNCGDNRLFVVEKDGRIRLVDSLGVVNPTPFLDINARVGSGGSEQGLLGLCFHPDYKKNGYFYVDYTDNGGDTKISRFTVTADPNVGDPASEVVLMTIAQPYSNHNGGCVKFGRDGFLYIGMGDGGSGDDPQGNGQNKLAHLGKMLRLDVDNGSPYSIPVTNPFYLDPAYQPEIWAIGTRNPWRYSFDRSNGDLWIGDVGQYATEEVDFEPYPAAGGKNWGWRCYEGNDAYITGGCLAAPNYDFPIFTYDHAFGCAITGGYVYRGANNPSFYEYYFTADYCDGNWWYIKEGAGATFPSTLIGQFDTYEYVAMGEDKWGEVYVTGLSSGKVWRLEDSDTTCAVTADIFGDDTLTYCAGSGHSITSTSCMGCTYQWFSSGTPMGGETTSTLDPTVTGDYTVIVNNGTCSDTSSSTHIIFETIANPTFSGISGPVCDTVPPVTLIGTPAGGTFYGVGITGNQFDPGGAGAGTYDIVYWYVSAGGCIASDTQSVVVIACPAGIDEQGIFKGLSLSPNPAQNEFYASFDLPVSGNVHWTLNDILGRTHFDGTWMTNAGKNQFRVVTAGLSPVCISLSWRWENQEQ